jgi:hypothetical protein
LSKRYPLILIRVTHNFGASIPYDCHSYLYRRLVLDPEDYERFAHFNPSKNYTRNLIATDDERYTLLLLCWNPNKASPIHDHPCDGCWMRVVCGKVQECRYVQSSLGEEDALHCVSNEIYKGTMSSLVLAFLAPTRYFSLTHLPYLSLHSCRWPIGLHRG